MGFMPGCRKPDWKCRAGDACNYCQRQLNKIAQEAENPRPRRRKTGNFEKKQPDGTTLYGPKETENRPGHRHGHRGDNFDRSPHSTIGSAALGDAHTYNEHKEKRTKRW